MYHSWNIENIYNKDLEIESLKSKLGILELEVHGKENKVKQLKDSNKTFAAKQLEKEVAELEKLYQEKIRRYEEKNNSSLHK